MSFDRDALAASLSRHGACVRVVVAKVHGSAPRDVGAAMLIFAEGQTGSIGGGVLEYDAAKTAREMLAHGEAQRFTRAILGPDLGQCCGGAVALLFELYETPPEATPWHMRRVEGDAERPAPPKTGPALIDGWFCEPTTANRTPLWIWGAGHVGRATAQVLAPLPDLALTLLDTDPARFPDPLPEPCAALIAPDIHEALAQAPKHAHHLIVTHSHDRDFALCDALLTHGFASAGLIGSATKWARFRKRLEQNGHAAAAIDRIRCPIGTKALGKHPSAIALGVAHALLMDIADQGHRPDLRKTGD